MPSATSKYNGNTLESQIQGVAGYAPSNLGMVGNYFKSFQPDTRMPEQMTVGQQYRAFAPDQPYHRRVTYGDPQRQTGEVAPHEEWVDAPARKLNFFGGPTGSVRVKRSSLAAQNGGQFGVVGY